MLYASALTTIKLSILIFYQRLFITTRFKFVTSVVGGVVLAWWLAVILLQILQCRPTEAIWDVSVPATCLNPKAYYIGVAVPNIATDIVMLCLPVRMVWRLQISIVNKVGLTITFLTGAL